MANMFNKMKNINISFSLRAFIIYFVILGSLSWYIVNNAIERLNDGMRQSAESVMVDMSHLLAAELEKKIFADQGKRNSGKITAKTIEKTPSINTEAIEQLFNVIKHRDVFAEIYQIKKTSLTTDIYITDQNGIVIYDSTNVNTGQDFSNWRDVRLTLEGKYGARTSFIDPEKIADDDEKIMVVAAPIRSENNKIIGVLSVIKPINSLEEHLETEGNQLKNYALLLVIFAIILGYLFSIWLTKSLEKISQYARNLAQGMKTKRPRFWDNRLDQLSSSVTTLRNQLDGKEYVEDYIHSLTHELKTPITSIRGAAELLLEDMPLQERQRFINNIHSSNNRMAQLVDKMLSLAKLESQTAPLELTDFDITESLNRLLEERQALIESKSIILKIPDKPCLVYGDRMLIRQAIANLLDNAIAFCPTSGHIDIQHQQGPSHSYNIQVFNQGEHIPDFAIPRLYERFFSMPAKNGPDSLTAKGTGLGLSFVKEIMKLHYGSITIDNTKNKHGLTGVQATITWQKMDHS